MVKEKPEAHGRLLALRTKLHRPYPYGKRSMQGIRTIIDQFEDVLGLVNDTARPAAIDASLHFERIEKLRDKLSDCDNPRTKSHGEAMLEEIISILMSEVEEVIRSTKPVHFYPSSQN